MLGRILGYTPHREASPGFLPLDVPSRGLSPNALLEAYNANPLAAAGFTGKGETIVFFEFGGYDQNDLDAIAGHTTLLTALGAAAAVAAAAAVTISVLATPVVQRYVCPPDCGRLPIGKPVATPRI